MIAPAAAPELAENKYYRFHGTVFHDRTLSTAFKYIIHRKWCNSRTDLYQCTKPNNYVH